MSKSREIELGKRKLSSDEFYSICEGKNVLVTLNSGSIANLQEKSTKRFPEFDLLQFRDEIDLTGKMTDFQTRAVLLQTILSILQERLHIRPQLVEALVDMLNKNVLPELPSLTEATDKQIMTDLVDSIDPATPKFVGAALEPLPPSPNNNESRRILQLRAPTQSSFITSAYKLEQALKYVDLPVALALEITGLSTEPFQAVHHDTAHPHTEAIETSSIIRNIIAQSQYANKYSDIIKANPQNEAIQNSLTVPDSFTEVPDLHGALKQTIRTVFQLSRKEIISGDAISSADEVYPGVQSLAYVHFYSQHVINIIITHLQTVFNRIQYILMNNQLFGLVLTDIEEMEPELLVQKFLAETVSFTSGLHLVDSLVSTNELVAFLAQASEKLNNAIIYEFSLYVHILQTKTVKFITQQQQQAEAKKDALAKKVEQLKAEGKEAQAQKIVENAEKNAGKGDAVNKSLPLGVGSILLYNTVMSYINQDQARTENLPFSIVLSLLAELISSADPSFTLAIHNVVSVSANVEIKMPKGTRDILQDQMIFREKAFDLITKVFKEHGAGGIDTPVFERRDILTGKYGEDSKLIFDLADQGGEMLSLRYDLTVPFARFCASNGITNIRRYHIGKVYRRDQPIMTRGRFREFFQCDFDIAGEGAPMCNDSEVISAMIRILQRLPIGNFKLKLSHRLLLDAIMIVCGVPTDKLRPICSAIDKLDKETWETVKNEMVHEKGLDDESANKLHKYVTLPPSSISAILPTLQEDVLLSANANAVKAFQDLSLLSEYLTALGVVDYVSFDLSLARGLDYYTGVIFEAVLVQNADGEQQVSVGSIGAGGRYDKLVGMFSGRDVPAVGASIGLERILALLEQRERANADQKGKKLRTSNTQVLVASNPAGNSSKVDGKTVNRYNLLLERVKVTGLLRSAGVCTEYLPTEDPNIRKQAIYAEEKGIPLIVWIGVDELENNNVSVKVVKEVADESEKPVSIPRDTMITYILQEVQKLKANETW